MNGKELMDQIIDRMSNRTFNGLKVRLKTFNNVISDSTISIIVGSQIRFIDLLVGGELNVQVNGETPFTFQLDVFDIEVF